MYTRKNQDMPIVQIIGSLRYIDGMKEKAWEQINIHYCLSH